MPHYQYRCESCGNEEDLDQPFGSPRVHACPKCEKGEAKRVLTEMQEAGLGSATPGACVQRAQENRNADIVMTSIRNKLKLPPKTDANDIAADRHWGRKNGLVK